MADRLGLYLDKLDEMLFPGSEVGLVFIAFRRRGDPTGDVIGEYWGPDSSRGERYNIFVEDLEERIAHLARAPLLDGEGNLLWDEHPTLETTLVSVAAHEVRHRIQHRASIRMWNRDSRYGGGNELLRQVLRALFKSSLQDKEFDAYVVEALVLHMLHRRAVSSLEEIVPLLQLQPDF